MELTRVLKKLRQDFLILNGTSQTPTCCLSHKLGDVKLDSLNAEEQDAYLALPVSDSLYPFSFQSPFFWAFLQCYCHLCMVKHMCNINVYVYMYNKYMANYMCNTHVYVTHIRMYVYTYVYVLCVTHTCAMYFIRVEDCLEPQYHLPRCPSF